MTAATPRSSRIPQAAAMSPKARCRVRSGSAAASRVSIAAAMSAALPRYRSEIIFGFPSTRPISRRYQYVLPPTFFGYRLAITLGHTSVPRLNQAPSPACHQGKLVKPATRSASQNHDQLKLRLAQGGPDETWSGAVVGTVAGDHKARQADRTGGIL